MTTVTHDTISLTQHIDAPVSAVWAEYADSSRRTQWAVPAGDEMAYDQSDFREKGLDRYRCGPPETLEFHVEAEYAKIIPHELIVYTETLTKDQQPLATALVTWNFEAAGEGTRVSVTVQVASFVGMQLIDGNRNGYAKALAQLNQLFAA